jgi:hypothetical protein
MPKPKIDTSFSTKLPNPFAPIRPATPKTPKPARPKHAIVKQSKPPKPPETINPELPEPPKLKGRPKVTISARLACEELVPSAIKALKAMLKRPGERGEAVKVVLAYTYGKPQSTSNVRVIHSVQDLTEEELLTIAGDAVDEIPLLEHSPDDDEDIDNE